MVRPARHSLRRSTAATPPTLSRTPPAARRRTPSARSMLMRASSSSETPAGESAASSRRTPSRIIGRSRHFSSHVLNQERRLGLYAATAADRPNEAPLSAQPATIATAQRAPDPSAKNPSAAIRVSEAAAAKRSDASDVRLSARATPAAHPMNSGTATMGAGRRTPSWHATRALELSD